jgi:serine protease AprX
LAAVRLCAIALVVLLVAGAAGREAAGGTRVVDSRVLAATAHGARTHFLVRFRSATQGPAPARAVVSDLRSTAASTQRRARSLLDRLGDAYESYWLVDALAVDGGRNAVDALAQLREVASIEPDSIFHAAPASTTRVVAADAPQGVEWNITRIGAPKLWAIGVTGQGIVYANADSGVFWQHPALISHYRGWNGSTATHDYNWWDAIHADIDGNGTNPCGFSSPVPCDDDLTDWHGTHTMGTAVGDDGAGNQIGVAPGAKWIACRNMDQGTGRPSTYIECLQWFLAPTDLQGRNPDPSKHPDIVGNSYACPPSELCSNDALRTAVDNMRAAGIFMAVAAGNEGPNCSSVAYPPGQYDSSISVGAVDALDTIAGFSSRGPVTVDGSGRLKPDLVAPGVSVRSSIRTGYGVLSGTSMAAPHVGGAVALLWSAFPNLRGDVDTTERLLEQSATPLTTAENCGGTGNKTPGDTYGYGRLDVYAAYQLAEKMWPAQLSAADVRVAEGNSGSTPLTFVVTLSRPSTQTVTVAYSTADGTARAGSDYTATSGTLSFAPGERSKSVTVQVKGDAVREPDETFTLRLSSHANAAVGAAPVRATIVNDDGPVTDHTAPRIAGLRVSGRAVRFGLSEAAVTTAAVRRGGRIVFTRTRALRAGSRSFLLPVLSPASYVASVTAEDAADNAGRASVAFRVR